MNTYTRLDIHAKKKMNSKGAVSVHCIPAFVCLTQNNHE